MEGQPSNSSGKKPSPLTSPRTHSNARSPSNTNEVVIVVNPLASISMKDKMYLTQALRKVPSTKAVPSPPTQRFKSADYLFDKEDDETNILVDGNVIRAASMYSFICLTRF